jgi:hypothetical protein
MTIEKFKDLKIGRLMLFLVICNLLIFSMISARSLTTPPAQHRVLDKKWLDINRWRCPFYNDGRYAFDEATRVAGGSWPFPYDNFYIFGAGPWVGAILDNDTFVTNGYNPNTAAGEFYATPASDWQSGTGNAMDRVYRSPGDWPPPQSRFGTDTTLVPQKSFSLQDMWCVYCDLSPDKHTSPGQPLGIEIYQTVYAWNYTENQDIFFITYKVKNVNLTDTIKKMYLGACMDPDIGDAADDMVSLIRNSVIGGYRVRDVGFAGDDNNSETDAATWENGTPGVIAYKFLESPTDPFGETLGMTSFKKFTIDIDPMRDGEQYMTMAGYDYRTGIRIPFDSADITPADKRIIQCTGPFDLAPGKVAKIVVAAIAAPYGDANESWASRDTIDLLPLAKAAATAQYIYDKKWLLPGPPIASNVVLIPADNSIRIVWDDLPERTPDPFYYVTTDSVYREFDFEGYKIYKSADAVNWQMLKQCDLINGLIFDVDSSNKVFGDTTLHDATIVKTRARESGVLYSLTDNNVTNGYPYYYKVASFDFNFSSRESVQSFLPHDTIRWIDTLSFESNPTPVSIRPRWEAPNYDTSWVKVWRVVGDTIKPGLKCSTKIVTPYEITRDTLLITFAGPQYSGSPSKVTYRFTVRNKKDGSLILDTVRFGYNMGTTMTRNFPPFGGTEIISTTSIPKPAKAFDSIRPLSGNYPKDKLTPRDGNIAYAHWAFRGSDYKIVWIKRYPDTITCKVIDMSNNGVEVPKTRFKYSSSNDSFANGWCFATSLTVIDSFLSPITKYIYINCGYFNLNLGNAIGNLVDSIGDGDEWYVFGYKGYGTAPYHNVIGLIGDPLEIIGDTTYALNVKVVPNPYIITNRWETNKLARRIAFTHLPAECTIRIFTMAGNLVKVIEHKDTGTQIGAQPMELGGTHYWDLLNEHEQLISSGVYIFHIQSPVGEQIGKFAVIQ